MEFALIPDDIWLFSDAVSDKRRRRLLETPIEEIVSEILQNIQLSRLHWEKGKKNGEFDRCQRPIFRIELQAKLIDLFHNGAGGIRAQYYTKASYGKGATKYTIDRLLHEKLMPSYIGIDRASSSLDRVWESFSLGGGKGVGRAELMAAYSEP